MIVMLFCALCAGLGMALLLPAGPSPPAVAVVTVGDEESWLRRFRWPLSAFAGFAVLLVVDGITGALGALAVSGVAYRVLSRSEPPGAAAARAEATRDLPYLVLLLGSGLRSGAAPAPALGRACTALPGAAADRLRPAVARLAVGVTPTEVWREVAVDPVLAPLGSSLSRSAESGASVVDAVERLAEDLADDARSDMEDRARTVGVRAALPLGLCLLPAFLLLGIVPLVAALLENLIG